MANKAPSQFSSLIGSVATKSSKLQETTGIQTGEPTIPEVKTQLCIPLKLCRSALHLGKLRQVYFERGLLVFMEVLVLNWELLLYFNFFK